MKFTQKMYSKRIVIEFEQGFRGFCRRLLQRLRKKNRIFCLNDLNVDKQETLD